MFLIASYKIRGVPEYSSTLLFVSMFRWIIEHIFEQSFHIIGSVDFGAVPFSQLTNQKALFLIMQIYASRHIDVRSRLFFLQRELTCTILNMRFRRKIHIRMRRRVWDRLKDMRSWYLFKRQNNMRVCEGKNKKYWKQGERSLYFVLVLLSTSKIRSCHKVYLIESEENKPCCWQYSTDST